MSKQARWIWYKGDFELYQSLLLHSNREERGHNRPCFWNLATPYPRVTFYTEFNAQGDTELCVYSNALGRVLIDGNYDGAYAIGATLSVPKGKHTIHVEVTKPVGLPAIYVNSQYLKTDDSWLACTGTDIYIPVGDRPHYYEKEDNPERFKFSYSRVDFVSSCQVDGGILYDFGKELCAEVVIGNANPDSTITVCYGESKEEALDISEAVLHQIVSGSDNYRLRSRAFRYLHIKSTLPQSISVYADYEYLPIADIGTFECDNPLVNQIWDMCSYTFHLNSREFFLDGIKRDRWVWSGDAYQSFMVDYCLYFDTDIIKRTHTALVGKPPYEQHINTINDYTLYMIIALEEYYLASGDIEYVRFIFERIKGLYDFTLSRLDQNGFMCQREGDWIFIDWSDMDKSGPLCAEQILLWKSHLAMKTLSELLGYDGEEYRDRADTLYENINRYFWNEQKGAYIDTFTSGNNKVTRHANIFAIMYDFADQEKQSSIISNVLNNDEITQITTPYFNLYQLMTRCKIGDIEYMQGLLESYWGGMIECGATSIWEEFDPQKSGIEHYEMYGRKFEKSLCHAWGAGPILLLSRYCLGVKPTEVAYKAFEVHPVLGKYKHIKGTVPLPNGSVKVELEGSRLSVCSTCEGGYILNGSEKISIPANLPVIIENYKH